MNLDLLNLTTQKKNQFYKKGIYTVEDLLRFIPRTYHDYRFPKLVSQAIENDDCSMLLTLTSIEAKPKCIKASGMDEKGVSIDLVWFNAAYLLKVLKVNQKYLFCGKVSCYSPFPGRTYKSIVNPIFSEDPKKYQKIFPIYSKIQGMSDDFLKDTVSKALEVGHKDDFLELSLIKKYQLMKSYEMERALHQPKTPELIEKAKERLIFDELFRFSYLMNKLNPSEKQPVSFLFNKDSLTNELIDRLPFKLTDDQLSTINSVKASMQKGFKTSALVQGDVGCGKTIVAISLMVLAAENGYQSALMAPTNVLALQHYEDIKEKVKGIDGLNPIFLHGGMKAKEKREALEKIKSGAANMIVGTHAVVSKSVEFSNLALSIVDEEHRFGVAQRNAFVDKSKDVHQITMSATPIPRSLALSIYGDSLDVYTIKTMPNGRKPVITTIESNDTVVFDFMLKEVKAGRQCYVVCPLIEDSESDTMKEVESVDKTFDSLKKYFKKDKEIKIGKITGKMKQSEVEAELEKFASKAYDIIVSTTIIEVGVNVPNSTVIAIKNAERFGIAQLHQLRGRVGRGSHQSYCILMTAKKDDPRMITMTETTDGFKIAEKDLDLRGLGDFIGTKQSGDNQAVMLMLANPDLYKQLKQETKEILKSDARTQRYDAFIFLE